MNKPLIAAAVFTLGALAFLVYCWLDYSKATQAAEQAEQAWQQTENDRHRLAELRQQLAAAETAQPPRSFADPTSAFGDLVKECGIDISQLKIEAGRAGPREQTHHTVRINTVPLETIGTLLEKVRTKYPYLQVQTIEMRAIQQKPKEFNWILEVAVPAPEKPAA